MSSILRSPKVDNEGYISQYTAALLLLEEVSNKELHVYYQYTLTFWSVERCDNIIQKFSTSQINMIKGETYHSDPYKVLGNVFLCKFEQCFVYFQFYLILLTYINVIDDVTITAIPSCC